MILIPRLAFIFGVAVELINTSSLSLFNESQELLAEEFFLGSLNLSTNISLTGDTPRPLDIKCSGDHFGWSPSISDCESAKGYIVPDSTRYAWGERRTGLGDSVFPLPYRIMGGTSGDPATDLVELIWS